MPASENAYSVEDLVRDLRAIVAATGDDREIVRRVMPLARRIARVERSRLPHLPAPAAFIPVFEQALHIGGVEAGLFLIGKVIANRRKMKLPPAAPDEFI